MTDTEKSMNEETKKVELKDVVEKIQTITRNEKHVKHNKKYYEDGEGTSLSRYGDILAYAVNYGPRGNDDTDPVLTIYNTETGEEVKKLDYTRDDLEEVVKREDMDLKMSFKASNFYVVSPDGKLAATCDSMIDYDDKDEPDLPFVVVWDIEKGEIKEVIEEEKADLQERKNVVYRDAVFSDDGTRLAVLKRYGKYGYGPAVVAVYKLNSGDELEYSEYFASKNQVNEINFNKDATKIVVAGGKYGSYMKQDTDSDECREFIAELDESNLIKIIDLTEPKTNSVVVSLPRRVTTACFNNAGDKVFCGDVVGTIRIYDAAGNMLGSIDHPDKFDLSRIGDRDPTSYEYTNQIDKVAVSHDDKILVASTRYSCYGWDIATGDYLFKTPALKGRIDDKTEVAFDRDNTRIVACGVRTLYKDAVFVSIFNVTNLIKYTAESVPRDDVLAKRIIYTTSPDSLPPPAQPDGAESGDAADNVVEKITAEQQEVEAESNPEPEPVAQPPAPPKRRGRPPGSKNKPKTGDADTKKLGGRTDSGNNKTKKNYH